MNQQKFVGRGGERHFAAPPTAKVHNHQREPYSWNIKCNFENIHENGKPEFCLWAFPMSRWNCQQVSATFAASPYSIQGAEVLPWIHYVDDSHKLLILEDA